MARMFVVAVLTWIICFGELSSEPACDRFTYLETLLEKIVRVEFKCERLDENYEINKDKMKSEVNSLHERLESLSSSVRRVTEEMTTNLTRHMTGLIKEKGKIENITVMVHQEIERVKEDIDKLSDTVAELQRTVKRSEPTVAFKAYHVSDIRPKPGDTLVFQKIILNIGVSYSTETGEFIAPSSGLYFFTVQMGTGRGSRIAASIMVGGQEFGRVYTRDDGTFASTSSDAVATMSRGMKTFVKTIAMDGTLNQSEKLMVSFSGFLIKLLDEH